ncbi:MAG TPA: SCO family protein [Stellaceae bacterium]|nr:SCO family protein [Stellaceae bacterium]
MDGDASGGSARRASQRSGPRLIVAASVLAGLVILGAGTFAALALHDNSQGASGSLLAAAIGGPFKLVDQNGNTITNTDLEGKWSLVYFGYTHCPDACPTALNNIALALSDLGPEKKDVRPVFITVDPERDTSKVMKDYVSAFDAPILALTGSPSAIAQAARAYRVYYAKHPEAGGDYSMDHSSIIYVMDPKGRFTASFTGEDPPDQIAARLKKLVG